MDSKKIGNTSSKLLTGDLRTCVRTNPLHQNPVYSDEWKEARAVTSAKDKRDILG